MAQWIRHGPTEPGIAGSSPAEVKLYVVTPVLPERCMHANQSVLAKRRVECRIVFAVPLAKLHNITARANPRRTWVAISRSGLREG